MDYQRTTEITTGIAREVGDWALTQFGRLAGELKYNGTLVTSADRECERMIRERLGRHFPDHTVFGEETGFEGPEDSDWIWYLDPIDGTSNFIFGLSMWGVSIGLAYRGQPVAGAFHMPVTGRTYWAWHGGGAFRNGQRLQVHDCDEMRPTDLVCLSSTVHERYRLTFPQKYRSLGCAAEALATTAAGSFAGLVHDHWHLHDIAAGVLLCREAGAVITLDDGTPFESFNGIDPKGRAPALVIAGPRLHGRILRCVQRK